MEAELIPIDSEELAQTTAAFQQTSYHDHLKRYIDERISYLQDKELLEPFAVMKCRGQIEELQHLLRPAFCHTMALLGLRARAERDRLNTQPPQPSAPPPWWADPPDVRSEHPVP